LGNSQKHGREFDDATSSAANKLKDQLSALSAQKARLRPTELTGSAAARLAPKPSSWGSGWGRGGGGGGWGASGDGWNTAHGSRTKDVMRKIKREVGNKKRKLTTPTHELNARRGGGWKGGKGGLNREMVEKLKRDAAASACGGTLAEERERVDTEGERETRFKIETTRRLGERRIGGPGINPMGPMGVVKRPSAPVISRNPVALPSRAPAKKPEKIMGPPELSQLTRKWTNPVTAGAPSAAGSSRPSINSGATTSRTPTSLPSTAQPQGIRKQQASSPSTTRTNISQTPSSAFLTNLRKLANPAGSSSPSSSSQPKPRDFILDSHPNTTTNTNTTDRDYASLTEGRNHWPGMPQPQKKLIPIVRQKKEPSLFVVKKPTRPGAGVGAGAVGRGSGVGAE